MARIKAIEQKETKETKVCKCDVRISSRARTEGSKISKGAVFKPRIVTDEHGLRQVNRRKRRKWRRANAECGMETKMDRGWRG